MNFALQCSNVVAAFYVSQKYLHSSILKNIAYYINLNKVILVITKYILKSDLR